MQEHFSAMARDGQYGGLLAPGTCGASRIPEFGKAGRCEPRAQRMR